MRGPVSSWIFYREVPSWFIDWDAVFRLGHSPVQAVHSMLCTAWTGECPNLKTVSQSMTHDGTFKTMLLMGNIITEVEI